MMALWILAWVAGVSALLFYRAHAWQWLLATVVWAGAGAVSGLTGTVATVLLAVIFVLPALVLSIGPL
ncbi:MAG: hypothetical protein J0I36_18850, partial [Pandoraea sp.]|nr:hypothetical protein [Pandoraea sp.]